MGRLIVPVILAVIIAAHLAGPYLIYMALDTAAQATSRWCQRRHHPVLLDATLPDDP